MRLFFSSVSTGVHRWLLALVFLVSAVPGRAAVDLNTDGLGDIWVLKYGAAGLAAGDDADGDGISNGGEAAAGTDPLSAGSTIAVSSMVVDGAGLHLAFPSLLGKGYQIQRTASLTPMDWQPTGAPGAGTGADLTITLTGAGLTEFFYRVLVVDVDTDGDGVNDWEELTLGFDPSVAHSNGLGATDDLARITAALQATTNTITISAVTPNASEIGLVPGVLRVTRAGKLDAVTVNYTAAGTAVAGSDYVALSGSVTLPLGVNAANIVVTPLADGALESPEVVIVSVSPGGSYTVGAPGAATVIISDVTTAVGTGLRANFYNEATTLNPDGDIPPGVVPTFTNLRVSRIDPVVDYDWVTTAQGTGSPAPRPGVTEPSVNVDYFSSRWTGEVRPEFSQVYTFSLEQNRCGRLWVNGQLLINKWPGNGDAGDNASGTYTAPIELAGGVRYSIVLEHFETTGDAEMHLRWTSQNQPLQIIPTVRLFADTAPQIHSATEIVLLKNSGVFNYQILASGSPTSYSVANLPPGWNPTANGFSGSPTQAGVWEIPVTATNAAGSGSAIVTLTVIETAGAITREVWEGSYASVAALPLALPPIIPTTLVTALEGPLNPGGADYGARLRGFLFAPKTGVYKFWIAGSDNAELWIADDDEPINLFLRAKTAGGTGHREWAHANAGKSALLYLEAGRRYSVEVRHADLGADGHVSVGWLKPGEGGIDPASAAAPSEVVPGYALSPYVAPAVVVGQSTLFSTALTAQGGAVTSGYGVGSIRLSADESVAVLTFSFANLTTGVTGMHLHDNTLPLTSNIVFDIDDAEPQEDGSYLWHFEPIAGQSSAQLLQHLKDGQVYLNIHTGTYPGGEIKGFFKMQAASQTFTAPAPAPSWTDDHTDLNAASRFLIQSTFGPSPNDLSVANLSSVMSLGYEGWIDNQAAKPVSYHYPYVYTNRVQTDPGNATYPGALTFRSWWRNSISAPDQLRQRVAFALSEILVISEAGPLTDNAQAVSGYYDMLLDNAFGNARGLLEAVTLHPAMGRYLDMYRNDKPDLSTGRIPNENYAREIKQLFSIGLNRLWPDGSLMINSKGDLIPTYDQNAIIGFSHVFTGWDYGYAGAYRTSFGANANWIGPMREVPLRHFTGQKRLLNNVVLPGLPVLGGQTLNPYASHNSGQYGDPAYQALAKQELDAAHDALFNHPNFGPFLCRQLIQRLVTSTPSRGYIYRVVSTFNNNGSGVRGDMKAVIKAILLDYEARSTAVLGQQGYGKQREPVLRVTATARALPAPPAVSGTYSQVDNLITVSTSAPHLYSNGAVVFLDFSGGTPADPEDAPYAISNVTTNGFTVRPLTSEGVTWAQAGSIITVTNVGEHNYNVGNPVYIDYTSGSPSSPADGIYTVVTENGTDTEFTVRPFSSKSGTYSQTGSTLTFTTATPHGFAAASSVHLDFITGNPDMAVDGLFTIDSVSGDGLSFDITAADSVARTGSAMATPAADAVTSSGNATTTKPSSLQSATYSQTADVVTFTTSSAHSFNVGQNVEIAFTTGTPSAPANGNYAVTSIGANRLQLTVTAGDSVGRTGNATLATATYVGNRSGIVGVNYSDWQMDTTNTDLNQTPMQSPTVFNFFLPDYQYPGLLAGAGLITPEFELTSETSVMRQANFLYNGIFNDAFGTSSGNLGLSSFKSGGRDIILDLRPWMGIGPGGLPWAHNSNLGALVDELNTRLCAGQLPSVPTVIAPIPAKTIISNYVQTLPYGKTITAISTASPCVITANGHGLTNGQSVTIAGVIGGNFSAPINGTFTVGGATTNTFNVGINRMSGGTALGSLSGATASPSAGYPDQLRDRVRAVIHLIITSPDFTIQK